MTKVASLCFHKDGKVHGIEKIMYYILVISIFFVLLLSIYRAGEYFICLWVSRYREYRSSLLSSGTGLRAIRKVLSTEEADPQWENSRTKEKLLVSPSIPSSNWVTSREWKLVLSSSRFALSDTRNVMSLSSSCSCMHRNSNQIIDADNWLLVDATGQMKLSLISVFSFQSSFVDLVCDFRRSSWQQ